jgi:hypothetical protein
MRRRTYGGDSATPDLWDEDGFRGTPEIVSSPFNAEFGMVFGLVLLKGLQVDIESGHSLAQ